MFRCEGAGNVAKQYASGTIIEAAHLNSIQGEIANVIEGAGIQLKRKDGDPMDQLYQALNAYFFLKPYSAIIQTQEQFNNIIERVGANHYQFKNGYYSIYLKYNGASYNCQSFCTAGDTWGYIDTNQTVLIDADTNANLDMGTGNGYLKVNTDHCQLKNVAVSGGSGAGARSFLLAAYHVTFINCKALARTSSAAFNGFEGSGTALHNQTSKYIGCLSTGLIGTANVFGFNTCFNMTNCIAYNITAPVSGAVCGFATCSNQNGCTTSTLSGTGAAYGFNSCNQLSGCFVITISSSGGEADGFRVCNNVTACRSESVSSTGGSALGFNSCNQVAGSYVYNCSTTGANDALGFSGCSNISGCYANKIDTASTGIAYAFNTCSRISGCYCNDIDSVSGIAVGFETCTYISACTAYDVDSSDSTAYGFRNCTYGASLYTSESHNATSNYMSTADTGGFVANQNSSPAIWT